MLGGQPVNPALQQKPPTPQTCGQWPVFPPHSSQHFFAGTWTHAWLDLGKSVMVLGQSSKPCRQQKPSEPHTCGQWPPLRPHSSQHFFPLTPPAGLMIGTPRPNMVMGGERAISKSFTRSMYQTYAARTLRAVSFSTLLLSTRPYWTSSHLCQTVDFNNNNINNTIILTDLTVSKNYNNSLKEFNYELEALQIVQISWSRPLNQ